MWVVFRNREPCLGRKFMFRGRKRKKNCGEGGWKFLRKPSRPKYILIIFSNRGVFFIV